MKTHPKTQRMVELIEASGLPRVEAAKALGLATHRYRPRGRKHAIERSSLVNCWFAPSTRGRKVYAPNDTQLALAEMLWGKLAAKG